MLSLRKQDGYFPIPLWLHRDHIKNMGYDASQLTDGDMEYLAQRMAYDYFQEAYARALRETVEYYMAHGKEPLDEVTPGI